MRKFPQKWQKIAGFWESAVYGFRPLMASKPGSSPPERTSLDNSTSQPWSDATCPCTTSTSAYFRFMLFLFEKTRQSTRTYWEAVVRVQVVSDHVWLVILSRPVRSGGDELGLEAMRGREHWTALSQHPAIFWHFCGNFCSVRGPLQKLPYQSRYEKRSLTYFWYQFKKRVGKSILTFRTEELFAFFFKGFRFTFIIIRHIFTLKLSRHEHFFIN